ncbi:transcriptional regulator Kaiso isoform X1 [Dryobates pubescens]|uniref:transcriptional regulator Kaiso isoform X1 n=2 Tax=Dryobates pubescens TaxID=118200 RepID=UPI0023B9D14D|nr:transcriptional regulator Kaiso isoform X1 [Dryobates pubescens]
MDLRKAAVPGMEGKKLISATDTQYSSVLLQSLNEQRDHGLFCDVTVIVEDQKFRAHRNILSASSTYFHQLFSVAGQVVELSFVRAEIFAEILNYIYSSKIISIRSDLLDELIKSGQQLGVKFIADLGIPLSDGKNTPSEVKDGASETSASGPGQRDAETQVPVIRPESHEATDGMPVITQSFSLHGIEYETTKITVSDSDDEDDDVIFCSEIVPPKECTKDKIAATQNQPCPSSAGVSDQKSCGSGGSPHLTSTTAAQKLSLPTSQLSPNQTQPSAESHVPATPHHLTPSIIVLNKPLLNSSLSASSSHQANVTPTINLLEENQQPSNNGSLAEVETTTVDDDDVVEDDVDIISSSSPGSVSSSSLGQQPSVPNAAATEGSGVQKKQVAPLSEEALSKAGEFKIKISDVLAGNKKELSSGVASKQAAEGQKIITLDTATEIGGLSTGCKVYANIGEDTYDVVIPVKGGSEEGEAKAVETPKASGGGESPNRKRMKVKHDDHYELIVDGRVYYICIVCKRSYACLTSLRRHFNMHSWEKKYPCRYCDKVFALAEYRTKHEIHHTGERRYQCLTCGKSFINYQITASHIRSVHSQEPSGDTKLYRLHPCKSLQIRQYTYISDRSSGIQGMNNGSIVYRVGTGKDGTAGTTSNSSDISWDDIFVPHANEAMFKQNPSEGSSEFEFVIPESY